MKQARAAIEKARGEAMPTVCPDCEGVGYTGKQHRICTRCVSRGCYGGNGDKLEASKFALTEIDAGLTRLRGEIESITLPSYVPEHTRKISVEEGIEQGQKDMRAAILALLPEADKQDKEKYPPQEKERLERELICIIHRAVPEFDNPIERQCARFVYGQAILHLGTLHGLCLTGEPKQEVQYFVKEHKGLWT